ncbi:MAG: DUF1700 domain-containing protein [Acholeplasmataceae bacterium]|nr:DUF1700 domain-containing protein [Acholeplasmataceae bacterium]
MQKWLENLKIELEKHFYPDEVNDILDYYEEMIEDRKQSGELLEDIYKSYDPKQIVREMMPDVLSKRTNVTQEERFKTTKQLWTAIAQTSLKIPLSIAYAVSIFVIIILLISVTASILGSLFAFVMYGLDLFEAGLSNADKIGMSGIALVLLSIVGLILINVYRLILELYRKILNVFSQWTKKKGEWS